MWIGPIVVNAAWLKKQPEDVQKAILEGGRLATENNRKMIAEMETELVKALKDKGVEILDKPEDESVWQEKAMNVWPQFYDKIGDISLPGGGPSLRAANLNRRGVSHARAVGVHLERS